MVNLPKGKPLKIHQRNEDEEILRKNVNENTKVLKDLILQLRKNGVL